jgi:hypothetical protein
MQGYPDGYIARRYLNILGIGKVMCERLATDSHITIIQAANPSKICRMGERMDIQLSVDKIAVEYQNVTLKFYNKLAVSFSDWYDIRPVIRHKGYVYHWNLGSESAYLHLCYQPWGQKKARKYSLRIETHPEYLDKYQSLLDALHKHTKDVYFLRCELAYDFPYPMNNVFVASNSGRNLNIYEGTHYFGRKSQRREHAYCRIYDKKAELNRQGIEIDGERTRVELVYRPDERIPMENIVQYPPKFNKYYTVSVIDSLESIKPEKRAIVLALQHGLMTPSEFTKHHRAAIKDMMSLQQPIDFDLLAAQHWSELITVPCALICGKVSHLPVRGVHAS